MPLKLGREFCLAPWYVHIQSYNVIITEFQCGFLTGATFGFVDVLRDSKAMSAKTSVGTAKVLRFGYMFAG